MEEANERVIGKQGANKSYRRMEQAEMLQAFESQRDRHNFRTFCHNQELPPTTLYGWFTRKGRIDAEATVVAFFEAPQGLVFLRRLIWAMHFVMGIKAGVSCQHLSEFLQLAGLAPFVASSVSSQRNLSLLLEQQIDTFGMEQQQQLALQMKPKDISVIADETFHKGLVCLVAQEALSGYLLVQAYHDNRTTATWLHALDMATASLPVKVIQIISDGAKPLKALAKNCNAQHSPDLFHVQHEIVKGCAGPLASNIRHALKLQRQYQSMRHYRQIFAQKVCQAKENQIKMREAWRGLGEADQVVDVSGELRSQEQVAADLTAAMTQAKQVAQSAGLSEFAMRHLEKAERVLPAMIAAVGFFYQYLDRCVQDLDLAEKAAVFFRSVLLPLACLQQRLGRSRDTQQRKVLETSIERLSMHLQLPPSVAPQDLPRLLAAAQDCAAIFQRSSSSVEGRNGVLSLLHQAWHRLRPSKLRALMVIHNFDTYRHDGSTPASRFFLCNHPRLFDHLLPLLPELPRPRACSR